MPFLLLVLLFGLGACAELAEPAGAEGPRGSRQQLEAGSPCSLDLECREGLACERSRRICICTSSAACAPGEHCSPFTGLCSDAAPGCQEDADCEARQWCDSQTRVCSSLRAFCEPCDRNAQCGSGNRCIQPEGAEAAFCGSACGSDRDCPHRGTSCVAGQCVPHKRCADLSPCIADSLERCEHHGDCLQGSRQICEGGRCVAAHSGCGWGQSCDPVQRLCLPACASDEACGAEARCRYGACHPIERCSSHDDCSFEKVCNQEGECSEACRSAADCPLGESCLVVEGRFLCVEGCREDGDCLADQLCVGGSCLGGDGRCQLDAVCGSCERCVEGICTLAFSELRPFCAPCEGEGPHPACGPGGHCLSGGCAPPCQGGCPKGFHCRGISSAEEGGAMLDLCVPTVGTCNQECL